jgi:hypothetical protein
MFNETPRKSAKAFHQDGKLDELNFDGPQTASTMFATGEKGTARKQDDLEFSPMRKNCLDWEEPASPCATKAAIFDDFGSPQRKNRFFTNDYEDLCLQAPTKNFDNRNEYDLSPVEFNSQATLFDTEMPQYTVTLMRTPEKRSELREFSAPEKPKVQLDRFQDIEPVEFNLEKRALFFSDNTLPSFDHLLDPESDECSEEDYDVCAAPKKTRRNDFAFTDEDDCGIDFNMDAVIFKNEPEATSLRFEFLLGEEEETQDQVATLEPSIMVSKGRAVPDFFKTQGAPCLSGLASPCLDTPSMKSNLSSYKKEKSMDGSISSSKRRSMLNTLSKKTSKV